MKKKILMMLALTALVVCMLAIAVSAQGLIPLDEDPGLDCDDSKVSYFSSIAEPKNIGKTEKAVLTDGTKFYVVPAYYVVNDSTVYGANIGKLNTAIGSDVFASLKAALVRIQLPSGMQQIRQSNGKFENFKALKELHFPQTLTVIQAQDAFGGCTSLEYISSIEHMTEINVACFSGCSKLAVDIVWPAAVTSIGRHMFADCTSLKSVTFQEGLLSIGNSAFENCNPITEVILPNSVVTISKKSFAYIDDLETISFGAGLSKLLSTDHNLEMVDGCPKLKYVYLPACFATEVQNSGNGILRTGTNVTIFFTGTLEQAEAIRAKLPVSGNPLIANAEFMAYNPDINYFRYEEDANYAQTLGKTILVYGYSACEAFYDGAHDVDEEFSIVYSGEELLSSAVKSKACANCSFKIDRKDLLPLFKSLGYSVSGNGDVVQGFYMETSVLAEYEAVLGEINYGVVAAIDTREDTQEGVDLFSLENRIDWDLSSSPNNYFDIKIIGITDELKDQHLFFCAYVKFGGVYYYINNGVVGTTAMSTTYNLAK